MSVHKKYLDIEVEEKKVYTRNVLICLVVKAGKKWV